MPSFSNLTSIPNSFKCLTTFKRSTVFLANLEIDFVRIISILPSSQSCNNLLKSLRFSIPVPLIPKSE